MSKFDFKAYLKSQILFKESYNPNVYQVQCKLVVRAGDRPMGDILSDIRAITGVTIVDTIDTDERTESGRHVVELSLKIDPSPFKPFNSTVYDKILAQIKIIPDVLTAQYTSTPISI